MSKAKTYFRNMKHILPVCFILFALSPCIVKESVFGWANVEYVKPPNKAKTTAPGNSCEYFQNESRYTSIVKQPKINRFCLPVDFSMYQYTEDYSEKTYFRYSKNNSGTSPPKYILYKQLKLDIV